MLSPILRTLYPTVWAVSLLARDLIAPSLAAAPSYVVLDDSIVGSPVHDALDTTFHSNRFRRKPTISELAFELSSLSVGLPRPLLRPRVEPTACPRIGRPVLSTPRFISLSVWLHLPAHPFNQNGSSAHYPKGTPPPYMTNLTCHVPLSIASL